MTDKKILKGILCENESCMNIGKKTLVDVLHKKQKKIEYNKIMYLCKRCTQSPFMVVLD